MIRQLNAGTALTVAMLLGGCGVPSRSSVKADFTKANPSWEVVSVGVGEGDGGAAYFHIKYRKPNDTVVYEDVWQYLDRGGSRWQLGNTEAVSPEKVRKP